MTESQSRRTVLQKLGLAGAAAWTAPVVLSAPASAQAQPSPPPGCSCGTELVVNGSFEANVYSLPTGWTGTGGSASAAVPWSILLTFTPPPGAGSNAASLRAFATLGQTIPVDAACAGQTYSFSSYARAFLGAGQIELAFDGSGAAPWTVAVPATFDPAPISLVNYTTSGPVPAGTTSITITFTFGNGNYMPIDLVSLTIAC